MRVLLIDGPLTTEARQGGEQRLFLPEGELTGGNAAVHAQALCEAIRSHVPRVVLDNFVVFDGGLSTRAGIVTRALEAALETDADVVHCSFGLPRFDPAMAEAVSGVLAQGKHLVASAPAFGAKVYPAAFPGVLAVQGDARCGPDDWTTLEGAGTMARYAAHAGGPDDRVRGASLAAAHFTGLVLQFGLRYQDMGSEMHRQARFRGRERRGQAAAD